MSVEILAFGCRLNAYELEVMRGQSVDLSDTVIVAAEHAASLAAELDELAARKEVADGLSRRITSTLPREDDDGMSARRRSIITA